MQLEVDQATLYRCELVCRLPLELWPASYWTSCIQALSISARCVSSAFQPALSSQLPQPITACVLQVDFNSVQEYDWISNYKILQASFTKLRIDKVQLFDRSSLCRKCNN